MVKEIRKDFFYVLMFCLQKASLVRYLLLLGALICTYPGWVSCAYGMGPVQVERIGWSFVSSRNTQGWKPLHDLAAPTRTREGLLLRSTGGDPFMVSPDFEMRTADYQYIRIRAKAFTTGKAQVFYSLDGRRFNETDSVSFGLDGDGEWHVYHLFASWPKEQTLERLRFDLPGGEGSVVILSEISVIERVVSAPVPDFPAYDFTGGAEVGPWMPDGGISVLDAAKGGMRASVAQGRGEILSPTFDPVGTDYSWLTLRLSNAGIDRILFRWRKADERAFSPAHEIPIDLPADGGPHTINTDVSDCAGDSIVQFSLVLIASEAGGEVVFERIALNDRPSGPACLILVDAGFPSSLLPVGEEISPLCTVRNVGGEANGDALHHLVLRGAPEANRNVLPEECFVPVIEPGRERTMSAQSFDVPEYQVPHRISVEVELRDGPTRVDSATAEGLATQTVLKDAVTRPQRGTASLTDEEPFGLVAANRFIQLRFPKNPFGYGVLLIDKYSDDRAIPMGILQSFGTLETDKSNSPVSLYCHDVHYEGVRVHGVQIIRFSGNAVTGADENWTVSVEVRVPVEEPWFRLRTTVACDRDTRIVWFESPRYLAGDGGFGAARDLGLFPGLEYLLPGEVSSGKSFVREPFNLRLAPHPHKVTIPLMAVQHSGIWTGMIWNPLQEWDGIHDRPTAIFSSPDRTGTTPGHRMGLAVPTISQWAEENSLDSSRPYPLAAGNSLTLEAVIFCSDGDDVDVPIKLWRDIAGGFPDPPPLPVTWEGALAAARVGYVESMWDADTQAWHRALNDPWGASYVEDVVLDLMWSLIVGQVPDEISPDRIVQIVEQARDKRIEEAGRAGLGLQVAFHEGYVLEQLRQMKTDTRRLVRRQQDDGSFPYEPDEEHAVFGRRGDSSSGHTAAIAQRIWQAAALLNDPALIESGLKSLDYFEHQKRPEGAQTWELPLHVPDVLASARIIQCYLAAYDLLGDESYLDVAEKWAYRALPFVYLWNPVDRPIMRYGSIPVFGATWFTGAWFGRIVQWNGLVLADALLELEERLPDSEWGKIAEGIVACGVQQQRPLQRHGFPLCDFVPDCGHRGMYPDAYSTVEGTDAYHWCLSGHLLTKAIHHLLGGGPFLKRNAAHAGDRSIILHSVARVLGMKYEDSCLSANLLFPVGVSHRLLVNGPASEPRQVTVSGREIPRVTEEPLIGEGWIWQDSLLLLAVRSKSTVERLEIAY